MTCPSTSRPTSVASPMAICGSGRCGSRVSWWTAIALLPDSIFAKLSGSNATSLHRTSGSHPVDDHLMAAHLFFWSINCMTYEYFSSPFGSFPHLLYILIWSMISILFLDEYKRRRYLVWLISWCKYGLSHSLLLFFGTCLVSVSWLPSLEFKLSLHTFLWNFDVFVILNKVPHGFVVWLVSWSLIVKVDEFCFLFLLDYLCGPVATGNLREPPSIKINTVFRSLLRSEVQTRLGLRD